MSMSNLKTSLYETFTGIANMVQGPLSTSKFLQEGVLTPEEFVAAGDLLVQKCPSWSWQESKNPQKGMPKEKQFLLTHNVPCQMRVRTYEQKTQSSETKSVEVDDGEGGWLQTHTNESTTNDEDIPEIPSENSTSKQEDEDDDVPEIDLNDLSIKNMSAEEDAATLSVSNVVRTRTYDISITYDQYHQTPRVWLFGYDENRQPLKPEEVLQDISVDHANKTVTTATHPHLNITCAYIHPCKHAAVMKKIVQRLLDSGREPRIDQYLFIFLKFIHAAIPTIEYDHTIEMEL